MPEITGVEVATQRASGGAEFTRRGPAAARLVARSQREDDFRTA